MTRRDLDDCLCALRAGGVVAYPTEAVYGLGCDPRNRRAFDRLFAIKQRPATQGVLLIAADFAQLEPYIDANALPEEARDRAIAPFAGAEIFTPETHARLTALPKDTPIAFICHHGNASRNAAEHFREHGFNDLYNVEGGIDAWSREIDPSIPRY